ncbi:MAG: SRPBCC family protein [Burkholderiaceae bacterium]|nr:MAG: SRPBCC family protein [Burkholderiaceae bacterium]
MLMLLAGAAGLALAALAIYAATRPDQFRIERSLRIVAPPERVFPLINDLHGFNTWNPFARKDPNLQGNYSGPANGPGARYAWQGNKNVGRGSMEILNATAPSQVAMRLDFIEPFEAHNLVDFTLVPEGGATTVTWAMHGPAPFVSKLMGIFLPMERMVGPDFEAGLATLKALAEKP